MTELRDLSLTSVFASLYVVINVVQMLSFGGYTIYGPIQLRVADCLIALAALLGWPIVIGVTIGAFLVNAYYFLGMVDVILGPIANFIAATLIFLLRRRQLLGCIIGALPIGLIVGGYLWTYPFLPPPAFAEFLPIWVASILSITISSLIAIAVIGYGLLKILSKPSIIGPLKAKGLKVFT
ncbi:MAG: QueT transporter family protein [Candidatus Bathyarchaeia archaeon]